MFSLNEIIMKIILKIFFSIPFDIFLVSLLGMWLMPYGTFDYKEPGFYISILNGFLSVLAGHYLLKKYQKDYMGKIK
jgi:hypothetical protein